ncbi:hypothetical protein [Jiella avicenniae]|uniref:Uncharacterized protein n=1 Tax=Jiella avicenniae TaxID=2907202 RepID=A0A9X1T802_9HYPH|nr:hypothetical protein [Jiella avicenniae]MCE7031000.1 hypothetical protein [Jiella avicenniae]
MEKQKKSRSTARKQAGGGNVWGVRGVSPETRVAVGKAARRAGVSIGEFCDRALRDAATETLKDQPPAPRLEDTLAQIAEKMAAQAEAQQERDRQLSARLDAMEARTAAQAEKGNKTPAEILKALSGFFRPKAPAPESDKAA